MQISKTFLIFFEKGIDKCIERWYNRQARTKKQADWNLTIEQQEEKYKAKQSAKYILVKKSYIYSYKSKRS